MSRQVFLLGVGLCLIALALALTEHVLDLQPGVTEANVRRIRKGMTEEDVRGLLGGPAEVMDEFESEEQLDEVLEEILDQPVDYTTPSGLRLRRQFLGGDGQGLDLSFGSWTSPSGEALVLFSHGRVLCAGFRPSLRPSFLQRVRSGFGR
jgi:hypothetical protein